MKAHLQNEVGFTAKFASMAPFVMMPLYNLHIRNEDQLEVDPDGTELPDIDAALTEALKVARELTAEIAEYDGSTVIEITDGDGRTILTVPFSDALRPRH